MTNSEFNIKTHIGEYLMEEFLKPLKLSQNALAVAIHVPATRIYEIINGRRKITIDTDLRLCKFFGLSDGFFLGVQEDLDRPDIKRNLQQDLNSIIAYKELEINSKKSLLI